MNFDAINCNKVADIPFDYDGYIGVHVTYLTKHDSSKFKVISVFNNYDDVDFEPGRVTSDLVNLDKPPWKTRGPCLAPTRIILKRVDD